MNLCATVRNLSVNRDINAVQVMLEWARGAEQASLDKGLSGEPASPACKPRAESPTSVDCGSMRKVGTKKRQKRQSQRSGLA